MTRIRKDGLDQDIIDELKEIMKIPEDPNPRFKYNPKKDKFEEVKGWKPK